MEPYIVFKKKIHCIPCTDTPCTDVANPTVTKISAG